MNSFPIDRNTVFQSLKRRKELSAERSRIIETSCGTLKVDSNCQRQLSFQSTRDNSPFLLVKQPSDPFNQFSRPQIITLRQSLGRLPSQQKFDIEEKLSRVSEEAQHHEQDGDAEKDPAKSGDLEMKDNNSNSCQQDIASKQDHMEPIIDVANLNTFKTISCNSNSNSVLKSKNLIKLT